MLFVSSGNSRDGISPVVRNQGESLIKAGVSLDYFAISGKGWKNYYKSISELRSLLLKSNFDILHAHYGLSAIVALLARRKERIVASFMGDDILGSRNSAGNITLSSKLYSWLNRNLARFFHQAIIVKSKEMQGWFLNAINKTFLIPNGVDLSEFKPVNRESAYAKTCWDRSCMNVIFVSDPSRLEKNYPLAEVAVRKLNNILLELQVVNMISNRELVYYYNAADCLVLPSFHEGSPNVIKEAMACNCPIVSTRVGDVEWMLGETEGCFLAENDPEDFAEKLEAALRYSEDKGRTNGRERIISLGLDSESVAKRIIELYHKVLQDEIVIRK